MTGSIKVFSKAAALLDTLAGNGEMTPTQLAEALGEPRSTIYRLLGALGEHGFVEPTDDNRYALGIKLFSLGNATAKRFDDIRAVALPPMKRVNEATRQTIYLSVRRGYEALCVERLDGTQVQLMIYPVGGTLPLHAGAVCRVLLAYEPPTFWEELLRTRPKRFTEKTKTSKKELIAELRQIVEQGYAISDEDVILGIAAIGVPVFDRNENVCAGLSLAGPRPLVLDGHFERNLELMRDAGAEVSRRLGYSS